MLLLPRPVVPRVIGASVILTLLNWPDTPPACEALCGSLPGLRVESPGPGDGTKLVVLALFAMPLNALYFKILDPGGKLRPSLDARPSAVVSWISLSVRMDFAAAAAERRSSTSSAPLPSIDPMLMDRLIVACAPLASGRRVDVMPGAGPGEAPPKVLRQATADVTAP